MKHRTTVSIFITILAAIGTAIVMTNREAEDNRLTQLLRSDSVTDNLEAIALLEHYSFDSMVLQLEPLLITQTDATDKAQSLIVARAFKENRVDDLDPHFIKTDLYESAMWWASKDQQSQQTADVTPFEQIAIDAEASPWIRRLAALHCTSITTSSLEDLISMAPHGRDGSVILTVLAIDRHIPEEQLPMLIERWSNSYDLELQVASILLASLRGTAVPEISSSNSYLTTISTICTEEHGTLAWRSMHKENGMIHPDFAMAGLIVDNNRFMSILVDSARAGLWIHPDHPVELARRFAPEVTELLPIDLLEDEVSREKWWSLFACGLLKEQR